MARATQVSQEKHTCTAFIPGKLSQQSKYNCICDFRSLRWNPHFSNSVARSWEPHQRRKRKARGLLCQAWSCAIRSISPLKQITQKALGTQTLRTWRKEHSNGSGNFRKQIRAKFLEGKTIVHEHGAAVNYLIRLGTAAKVNGSQWKKCLENTSSITKSFQTPQFWNRNSKLYRVRQTSNHKGHKFCCELPRSYQALMLQYSGSYRIQLILDRASSIEW